MGPYQNLRNPIPGWILPHRDRRLLSGHDLASWDMGPARGFPWPFRSLALLWMPKSSFASAN